MEHITNHLLAINARIKNLSDTAMLVAVSKFRTEAEIIAAIKAGQKLFGENRVQEANSKWPAIKAQYPDVKLHLIGALQTNKIKDALKIFDVIEVVDRPKLADALLAAMKNAGKFVDCYIQVNTGNEPQKAGITIDKADEFIQKSIADGLPVKGLMCIPPVDEESEPHFKMLKKLADKYNLPVVSMGMSGDFEEAIKCGATHVRVGTAIFGERVK
jgi:pyridoxal phosphate enzyme (YggS family)